MSVLLVQLSHAMNRASLGPKAPMDRATANGNSRAIAATSIVVLYALLGKLRLWPPIVREARPPGGAAAADAMNRPIAASGSWRLRNATLRCFLAPRRRSTKQPPASAGGYSRRVPMRETGGSAQASHHGEYGQPCEDDSDLVSPNWFW